MTNYVNINNVWKSISKVYVNVNNVWKNVSFGYVNINNVWKQFFTSLSSYTFNFGNTIYIGTNGYVSLDQGNSSTSITSTVGRVLGIFPQDLVQDYLSYAAGTSYWYVLWQGHRYTGSTGTAEIKLEMWFPNGLNYIYVNYTLPSTLTPTNKPGIYNNGSAIASYSSSLSSGNQLIIYSTTTAPTESSFYFTPKGNSWGGWINLSGSSGITSGSTDDGYYTMPTFQSYSPSAPTSVTNSSVANTTATVSWSAPTDNGGSQIVSYDYSLNYGSTWTSSGFTGSTPNTSVNLTGLSGGTSYTVYVRANNYGGSTGTNYGSTSFTTISAPGAFTYYISDSTPTPYWPSGSGITISGRFGGNNILRVTWNAAVYASSYADSVSGVASGTYNVGNNTSDTWGYSSSGNEYATVTAYNTNCQFTISWTASSNATSYYYAYQINGSTYSGTTTGTAVVISASSGQTINMIGVSAWTGANATGTGTAGTAGSSSVTVSSTSTSSSAGPTYITYVAAGVAPSAPSVSGDNSITPHGGHFYWSSTGTAPIGYVFSIYSPSGSTVYSTYGSTSSATSFAVGTGYYTTAGNYTIYIYASNAYGTSSTTVFSQYMS